MGCCFEPPIRGPGYGYGNYGYSGGYNTGGWGVGPRFGGVFN
jgi:hypothetical protein